MGVSVFDGDGDSVECGLNVDYARCEQINGFGSFLTFCLAETPVRFRSSWDLTSLSVVSVAGPLCLLLSVYEVKTPAFRRVGF